MTIEAKPGLVLVLEDDRRSAEALALLIDDWGYECVHGAHLDEVLPTVRSRSSDVRAIISDYHLKDGATGIEAVTKAAGLGIAVPILLLTGSLHGVARRAAKTAGYRFMEKPVAPERLKAWLEQVMIDQDA